MSTLSMDDGHARQPGLLVGFDVWDEHILQAQVEPLMLGAVRQEEERPKTQGNKGTEDQEENELLREPQCGPVM